jgi:hypothetical protein
VRGRDNILICEVEQVRRRGSSGAEALLAEEEDKQS